MQLFYNPLITENSLEIIFSKDESKHIVKVLRKKCGEILYSTNGKGWLFTSEIISADIKKCIAKIITSTKQIKRSYSLHLAVAPTKMNDRFEWFLEKATEIGVDSITPIICEHSERKLVKMERFKRIIETSMKQSLQYYLPKLNDSKRFNDFIDSKFSGQKFIAHCEDMPKNTLKSKLAPHKDTLILIGPEGDFSKKEIQLAMQLNYNPVNLGNTRLRTETAAIVACNTFIFINE